jgi:hypothetical protein
MLIYHEWEWVRLQQSAGTVGAVYSCVKTNDADSVIMDKPGEKCLPYATFAVQQYRQVGATYAHQPPA